MTGLAQEERLFPVPTEAYEAVLGEDMPDDVGHTVRVDRRGYAPSIAEELGEHYLNGRIVVFGEEQLAAPVLAPDFAGDHGLLKHAAPEDLQDRTHEEDDYPFVFDLAFELDLMEEHDDPDPYFTVWTMWDKDVFSAKHEAYELRQRIDEIGQEHLKDAEELSSLVTAARNSGTDLSSLSLPWFNGGGRLDRFRYHRDGTTGYVMNPENPLLVAIGGGETPFEEHGEEDWVDLSPSDTLQELFDNGSIEKHEGAIHRQLDKVSHLFLQRFKHDVDGDYPHPGTGYNRLQQYLEMEDELSDKLRTWRSLLEEDDMSLPDNTDLPDTDLLHSEVKYLTGFDEFYEEMLRDVEAALKDDDPLHVKRLRGLETCIGDIQEAYREWVDEWSRNRGAASYTISQHNLEYNEDAILRFCSTTELEGPDGAFISELINYWDGDYIELPDMNGIHYIGKDNDGTEIIVDGIASPRGFAKNMAAGRIEVKDLSGTVPYVGRNATGGEIYIHGRGKPYSTCDATVYRKKGGLLRKERWEKIN